MPIATRRYKLPTKPQAVLRDIRRYILLLFGREKIGKTKFLSGFPRTLFAMFEPGAQGLPIHSFPPSEDPEEPSPGITSWDVFIEMIDLLEEDRQGYKMVVVDTVDRAYDMCRDWVCKERFGTEYPGVNASGQNDYGKSWAAVAQEMIRQLNRLIHTGVGIYFISHVAEKGGDMDRSSLSIQPSYTGQAKRIIEPLVDIFLYAEYVTDVNGVTQRVVFTEGSEYNYGGKREIAGGELKLPPVIPLVPEGGYEMLMRLLRGEEPGLDPVTFLPNPRASATVKRFVNQQRMTLPRVSEPKTSKAFKKSFKKKKGGK
jgi:hypothetical protein